MTWLAAHELRRYFTRTPHTPSAPSYVTKDSIPYLSRAASEISWAARTKSAALPLLAAKRWMGSPPPPLFFLAFGGSVGPASLARHRQRRAPWGPPWGLPLTQASSGPAKASHVAILQTLSSWLMNWEVGIGPQTITYKVADPVPDRVTEQAKQFN